LSHNAGPLQRPQPGPSVRGRAPVARGVAVAQAGYSHGEPFWECIVSDGHEWHFVRVLGIDLSPAEELPIEDIEHGIERFAATFPESDRLRELLNANPLHVDRSGTVGS
jgi:hypothetical protein